jgi:AcrR family transcriptional regulator
MGRPPLTEQRTEQILDGVVACILRYGMAGTTRSRIADEAGVQPSAVHHFVGTKDQVIGAAVDRALGRVTELAVESLADLPPAGRLPTQLDILFGETLASPDINQLVDELVADSYHTPATRHALAGMYRTFQSLLDESLSEVYPGAEPTALAVVNHGLLALAHASPTLAWLDFDPDHYAKVRRAADLLLSALDGERGATAPPAATGAVPVGSGERR